VSNSQACVVGRFEYAGERSGRFQGFSNEDGSVKTECGIHTKL
jgi:phosphoadenosine phosphosulfate reductase